MRCWRTPDGRLLVEGPEQHPGPAHLLIEGAHVYYLLAAGGRVERIFQGGEGAFDDEMYRTGYAVKDGKLFGAYRAIHDSGREVSEDKPEIEGLRDVDPAAEPVLAGLEAALAAFRRR